MANNQAAIAEAMGIAGAAIPLGWHSDLSARSIANEISNLAVSDSVRRGISLSGRALVDGYGADRVAQTLLN